MIGLLNINKPAGMTSRDVVNRVQRIVRPDKVGHAGTLDPLATGVLMVCIGAATRLIEYVQRMPKRYIGSFLLGRESDTEDVEGRVTELTDAVQPTSDQLEQILSQFVGEIAQRPPDYSALKVQGQRAYRRARRGETLNLEARKITIHSLELLHFDYPEFVIDVTCGSGTYIRSLGRDIAHQLGTAAVLANLQRTRIGGFQLSAACDCELLSETNIEQLLLPTAQALADVPSIVIEDEEASRLRQGQRISNRFGMAGQEAAAFDVRQNLVAVVAIHSSGEIRPLRTFPPEFPQSKA